MRKVLYGLLVLMAFVVQATAQETLSKYKVDSYLSISLPGAVTRADTILSNVPVEQHIAISGMGAFIVQKLKMGNDNSFGDLPYDEASLDKYYKNVIQGFFKKAAVSNIRKGAELKVAIGNRSTYSVQLMSGNRHVGESRFIILGDILYSILYLDMQQGYNTGLATPVFKSIVIAPGSPLQFNEENSTAFKVGEMLALPILIGIIVLITVLVIRRNKKNR